MPLRSPAGGNVRRPKTGTCAVLLQPVIGRRRYSAVGRSGLLAWRLLGRSVLTFRAMAMMRTIVGAQPILILQRSIHSNSASLICSVRIRLGIVNIVA
eukprot:119338-Pyramimonas_sp.AAC.1